MRNAMLTLLAICAAVAFGSQVHAQAPAAPPPGYGAPITLDQAKAAVAAAEVEGKKNGWNLTFAVVGPSGDLIYFEKSDLAGMATVKIAQDKAMTSALFRAPTKAFMDRLQAGETYVMTLRGVTPVAGGMPIVVGGKLIGAIGVSGATALQDHQVAQAAIAAVK